MMRHSWIFATVVAISTIFFVASESRAVQPDEVLADPALEARARSLSAVLRCVVCQNQSLDDSNASIARDLRLLLRERISNGDTDEEALQYLVDRYGAFILLKPPVTAQTLLLWIGPLMLLAIALVGFWRLFGNKGLEDTPQTEELSVEEREILQSVLGKDKT